MPNDNSKGKSSRFKLYRLSLRSRIISHITACDLPSRLLSQVFRRFTGHTTEYALAPPTSYSHSLFTSRPLGHATARVRSHLFSPRCLSINTMTPSVSTGFQARCFLPEDPPPHRRITSPSTTTKLPPYNQLPLPSIESTLPPPNVSTLPPSFQILPLAQRSTPPCPLILPPPSATFTPPLSTLPPSNVVDVHQPSNVYYVPPPLTPQPSNVTLVPSSHSASPPLPTMLFNSLSNSLPLILITLPPPFHTCHRTSAIISPEAPTTFLQSTRTPSLHDEWPSGATDTCLSHPSRPFTRYARDGQLVLEFLCKTHSCNSLPADAVVQHSTS